MSLFGNNNSEFETELLDDNLIGEDVQDKITYWILKIIIEMGGHKRFIDSESFSIFLCNKSEDRKGAFFLSLIRRFFRSRRGSVRSKSS